jgi:hypothetical protein
VPLLGFSETLVHLAGTALVAKRLNIRGNPWQRTDPMSWMEDVKKVAEKTHRLAASGRTQSAAARAQAACLQIQG